MIRLPYYRTPLLFFLQEEKKNRKYVSGTGRYESIKGREINHWGEVTITRFTVLFTVLFFKKRILDILQSN